MAAGRKGRPRRPKLSSADSTSFTNGLASVSMAASKATRRRRGPDEGGSNPFRTMMKAAHQTFDIRCSVARAAAMRLAVLPAELRLICP
jgi:hypothetical protein